MKSIVYEADKELIEKLSYEFPVLKKITANGLFIQFYGEEGVIIDILKRLRATLKKSLTLHLIPDPEDNIIVAFRDDIDENYIFEVEESQNEEEED